MIEFLILITPLLIGLFFIRRNDLVFELYSNFILKYGPDKCELLPSYDRLLFDISLSLDEKRWLDYVNNLEQNIKNNKLKSNEKE